MELTQRINRIFDRIVTWAGYLAIALLVFSWMSVCTEVMFRYFMSTPIPWVVEVTEYILVQITFLGCAWLLRQEKHVSVDLVTSSLSPRNRAVFFLGTSIIGFIISVILTIFGSIATWGAYRDELIVPKQLSMPKYLVMIVIPVGCLLLSGQFLQRIGKAVQAFKTPALEPGRQDG